MYQISTDVTRALINYLSLRGLESSLCFDALGITEQDFNKLQFVSAAKYDELYDLAERELKNDKIGFEFARHSDAEKWGILGNIAYTSKNLEQALLLQQKYQSITGSIGTPVFQSDVEHLSLLWLPSAPYNPNVAEEIVTSWVEISRRLTAQHLKPIEVMFSHSRGEDTKEAYENYFGCPVTFGVKQNGLRIDKSVLLLDNSRANTDLNSALTHYADALLQKLSKQDPVSIANKFIRNALPSSQPKLADLAVYLGTSERSLQRQLAQQDTTFKHMLNRCRHQLSQYYLTATDFTIEEVSALLSFSEPSAFIRAFKGWEQQTPSQYRTENRTDI